MKNLENHIVKSMLYLDHWTRIFRFPDGMYFFCTNKGKNFPPCFLYTYPFNQEFLTVWLVFFVLFHDSHVFNAPRFYYFSYVFSDFLTVCIFFALIKRNKNLENHIVKSMLYLDHWIRIFRWFNLVRLKYLFCKQITMVRIH